MDTPAIPDDSPRQDRYCAGCGRATIHRGLRVTMEGMLGSRDMRPSGGVRAWVCSVCGRSENVIESPGQPSTEESSRDLERWEGEGGASYDEPE